MKWISVIGIGEEGVDSLSSLARVALERAQIIIGASRHHGLVSGFNAERMMWPTPFRLVREDIAGHRGKQVVVLVTGDPLWYSAGSFFAKNFPDEVTFFPQISAFQWAATRMGWNLAKCHNLTTHGRAVETILPFLAPDARLLVLTDGADGPNQIGQLLLENGYGASVVTMLAHMGGVFEKSETRKACEWVGHQVPPLNTLAIVCKLDAGKYLIPSIGLDDSLFEHDGKITKREMRALTLAALDPKKGQLLWDIGAGCGSVAIEWLRFGYNMRAVGLEISKNRRAMALRNARRFGVPHLDIYLAHAPEGLHSLPAPDAVFIGGGLNEENVEISLQALKAGGRLVANGVTLESEARLVFFHQKYGGRLLRLSVNRAEPVGRFYGWRALMPITQWVVSKAGDG